nr:hypothetical protein [Kofleriaceae bacterium]
MGRHAAIAALLAGAAATVAAPTARADDAALTAILAKVDAAAKEVSKIRGLPLKKPVATEILDRDELRARVVAQLSDARSQAQLAATGLVLARLGEIPPGTDYQALLVDLLTEQIAGFYDPATKKLALSRAANLDDANWADMVLAHELDHALQDQSFDLHKLFDLPPGDGDASAARHALVEGDGFATMIEVALAHKGATVDWSNAEVATVIDKMMEQGAAGCAPHDTSCTASAFDRAPLAVREALIFPYRAGFKLVAALRHRQAWSAVDAAFRRPPRSTEQVIHPERYLAGDEPVAVQLDRPPSLQDWGVGASLVWGEQAFDVFLRAHGVDAAVAAEAAAGWGGDRVLVLTKPSDATPDSACAIARMDWDSEADAIEAAEAATRAVDDLVVGATIERDQARTRWLGLDGTVSWVERKGPSLVMVVGAPAALADSLATEVWALAKTKKK